MNAVIIIGVTSHVIIGAAVGFWLIARRRHKRAVARRFDPIVVSAHEAAPLRTVCAWCTPGVHDENTTHGICDRHAEAMLAEVRGTKADPISPKENQQS